jgi:hypothetical protein
MDNSYLTSALKAAQLDRTRAAREVEILDERIIMFQTMITGKPLTMPAQKLQAGKPIKSVTFSVKDVQTTQTTRKPLSQKARHAIRMGQKRRWAAERKAKTEARRQRPQQHRAGLPNGARRVREARG